MKDEKHQLSSLLLHVLLLSSILNRSESSKAYPIGCANKPPSYYDYENAYPWPPPKNLQRVSDDFYLVRRLGSGKFSDVFEAVDVSKMSSKDVTGTIDPNTLVVIKCLKPVLPRKIRRELLVLSHARKLPNLARLVGIVLFSSTVRGASSQERTPALVLEHAGRDAQWFCHGVSPAAAAVTSGGGAGGGVNKGDNVVDAGVLTLYEIKYYLYHLLVALDALHAQGIMHRDVKPRNVLITRCHGGDNSRRALMLIDLGLADFYLPGRRYNVRVASRHYKAPELLTGDVLYNYAVDMWGVGCLLAGLLLRREPFFRGRDNVDQLFKIVNVLGTRELIHFLEKRGVTLDDDVERLLFQREDDGLSLLPQERRP
mmetsp:Transcript_16078/g.20012  ORF Transcript_16078/g.20012 Transcript_16078/m.20012 type:complete len:370 (+) Transcript_16078:79-1188(+)